MLIALNNVTHFFGYRLILKNVNFCLEKGKLYLLRGRNGSGKSTLLKIMAGLLKPTEGDVVFNMEKTKIGYLAHSPFIYPYFSAMENLSFFAKIYSLKIDEEKIIYTLESVGLEKFATEKVKNFSRGMKQRLNLARIFLLSPELLLLDEPETGLDEDFIKSLNKKIKEVVDRGGTVVWISHSSTFSYYDVEVRIKDKKLVFS
ncbi:heme exporter protein A [Desulfonauticus submarinus]|uniref:Heme exporter protein A n=1 Tax=Desulfonauticus submarinus TaxID=206665 RepID=A0A1H0AAG9_9BACT|nr:heme ABC exporter ATP-binding protein CcmA [Desulfonauticus submarinus]SDN30427.1 heme exporter protein A [Desulfonauticus submarinus]